MSYGATTLSYIRTYGCHYSDCKKLLKLQVTNPRGMNELDLGNLRSWKAGTVRSQKHSHLA
uniref:Uncharacterized protein n=1 Tax=Arundo donax TaxID=35708 RepID=A0A0A8ZPV7_ARUDO